jgi:hypothetical protein
MTAVIVSSDLVNPIQVPSTRLYEKGEFLVFSANIISLDVLENNILIEMYR